MFFFVLKGNLDYHADMDSDNFNRWAEEAFASLPPGSVIVMVRLEIKYSHPNIGSPFQTPTFGHLQLKTCIILRHKIRQN